MAAKSGKWIDYWRIVTPKDPKNNYVSTDYQGAGVGYNNYSWYSNIMKRCNIQIPALSYF
jgi:hypothetical protein